MLQQRNSLPLIDDLKLYATNDKWLQTLLLVVHEFNKEMNVEFCSEKRAKKDSY